MVIESPAWHAVEHARFSLAGVVPDLDEVQTSLILVLLFPFRLLIMFFPLPSFSQASTVDELLEAKGPELALIPPLGI